MKTNAIISIGGILIKWRLKKNKTIYDCASALNIPVEYLDAVERGDFKLLPSQDYLSKVIDKYKNFLNITGDDNDVITEIIANFNQQNTQKKFQLLYKTKLLKFFKNFSILILMLIAVTIVTDENVLDNHFLSFLSKENTDRQTDLNNSNLNYESNHDFGQISNDIPQNNIIQITATGDVWLEIYNERGDVYLSKNMKKNERYSFLANGDEIISTNSPSNLIIRNGEMVINHKDKQDNDLYEFKLNDLL
ncbi:MAG: helix-turn-helix domain-containing protein [Hyphomicrobiales bacterium]